MRVLQHLNGLSHPIIGDAKHGDSRLNRWWRQEYGFRHLGLHCHEMSLRLADGEAIDVRCPVAPHLIYVWREMPWWPKACAAMPTLVEDAEEAKAALAYEFASEPHLERAAAAGHGVSVFHRLAAAETRSGAGDLVL